MEMGEYVAEQLARTLETPFSLAGDAEAREAQLAAMVAAVTALGTTPAPPPAPTPQTAATMARGLEQVARVDRNFGKSRPNSANSD